MAKRRKKSRMAGSDGSAKERPSVKADRPAVGAVTDPPPGMTFRSWFRSNRTDLRFLLIFGLMMAVYYFATTTTVAKESLFPWYLRLTTAVSGGVMQTFGYDGLTVGNNVLKTASGSITVERGCDAIAPTMLFISAVVASPTSILMKLPAVFGGALVLMAINLVRIITLFLTRIHWPKAFDIMHLDVWQAMFIFLAILLWAVWASWATKRMQRIADVAT